MRLAVSGGGTGGHVYPALSVIQALRQRLAAGDELKFLYLGSPSGAEARLVERCGVPFCPISSAPIRGRMPWEMAANAARIGAGALEARRTLRQFGPDVVLATGGYTSFPVALAASSNRTPLALYLPDVHPGWAIRAMARLAKRIAVTAADSLNWLPKGKGVVTGYPVREEFWQVDRKTARERLGLDHEEKVLLVSGASQGAHSINMAVANNLPALLELCEVVHLCGQADEGWLREKRERLPGDLRGRYRVFAYMDEDFPWAMAAADLALCRSGASVMGELPAVGLPAVLVPYPYAGGHQRWNARRLKKAGAARVLENSDLPDMLPLIGSLLSDDEQLTAMRVACRSLARPEAARDIAGLLLELAEEEHE